MATGQNLSQSMAPLDIEAYGDALAHIIKVEISENGKQEQVLGQAWLVGFNKLITCGHVVDGHLDDLPALAVRFPKSGSQYAINEIKLHPNFMRDPQLNHLVKFDAALLSVDLSFPESEATPLPIAYDRNLPTQLSLTAVRFPTHLGQFSSLNPLAQMGRLLGPLRKQDNFHLLHDLALSPGDSGSAIFDEYTVVAMHCGDTASLPGLNLPTTSIRLCLSIDALKELGVQANSIVEEPNTSPSTLPLVASFILAFLTAFVAAAFYLGGKEVDAHKVEKPAIEPINVQFNRPKNGYMLNEKCEIVIKPRSSCYVYVFGEVSPGQAKTTLAERIKSNPAAKEVRVYRCYPPENFDNLALINKGDIGKIDRLGPFPLKVNDKPDKFHVFAVKPELGAMKLDKAYETQGKEQVMLDDSKTMQALIERREKDPDGVMHIVMEGPVADAKLGMAPADN